MSVFKDNAEKMMDELKGMGLTPILDEKNKRLVVNDTYEISYVNFYYFCVGESRSIGRGERDFMQLCKSLIKK